MTRADTTAVDPAAYLDFLFDGSGWKNWGASQWHICASGDIGGVETLAVAIGDAGSPLPAEALDGVAQFLDSERRGPLILVPTPSDLSNGPGEHVALSQLLATLSRYRQRHPVIALVPGPLVGPLAILARLADMIFFGPGGSLALAEASLTNRLSFRDDAPVLLGGLNRRFTTDAGALFGVRRLANLLSAGWERLPIGDVPDCGDDLALDRLSGSDTGTHVDERRLIGRIADNGTFTEFDGSGNLRAFLARMGGETIGILASGEAFSGSVDAAALAQARTLVDFCGRHGIPVVTLVDCPGVVPDEAALVGLSSLVSAWVDSGVSVVGLVVRKAIGAAAAALLPTLSADQITLHWPNAQAGLLRNAAAAPMSRQIAARETRRALVEALASLKEKPI